MLESLQFFVVTQALVFLCGHALCWLLEDSGLIAIAQARWALSWFAISAVLILTIGL